VVFIDCLDQIKFTNGFESSIRFLKNVILLARENSAVLVLSIPPMMFDNKERQILDKELSAANLNESG